MIKTIGLTYDLKSDYVFKPGEPQDANAEFDNLSTVQLLEDCFKSLGYEVKRIGNSRSLLKQINSLNVDLVFNISEGLKGRNRESEVPMLLEMMNIPFVGSDSLTMGLTLDKILTKKILLSERISTPHFMEAQNSGSLANLDHLKFPLIVKPRYEGSSKGLCDASRVEDLSALTRQVELITNTYNQPALIEEFINGFEYTVAIIGNEPDVEVFSPVQIKIDNDTKLGEKFYTFAHIYSDRLEYIYPADIPEKISRNLKELALRTYRAVGCTDFGRVDIRTDYDNNPYVLEINPLPCLSNQDVFMLIAEKEDIPYAKFLGKIIDAAIKRYKLEG